MGWVMVKGCTKLNSPPLELPKVITTNLSWQTLGGQPDWATEGQTSGCTENYFKNMPWPCNHLQTFFQFMEGVVQNLLNLEGIWEIS